MRSHRLWLVGGFCLASLSAAREFSATCDKISLDDAHVVTATCTKMDGTRNRSRLDLSACYTSDEDGVLRLKKGLVQQSYKGYSTNLLIGAGWQDSVLASWMELG